MNNYKLLITGDNNDASSGDNSANGMMISSLNILYIARETISMFCRYSCCLTILTTYV